MMKRWGLLGLLLLLLGCRAGRPLAPPATTRTPLPPTHSAALQPTEEPTAEQTAVPRLTATAPPDPTSTTQPTATLRPTQTAVPETAALPTPLLDAPAVTRRAKVERWQNVAEYSFFSQSRQEDVLFTIYTPPGYNQTDQRYPVLYFLHGSQGSQILFWNAISREVDDANGDAGAWITRLIESGELPPFIIVAARDDLGGWTTLSETMATQELIAAIDGNWRTIAARNGRSLTGFSMGAMGATIYPARHPDLYCNTMLLAESGVLDTTTFWVDNQEAVLASGLEVALVVGERDTRAVNATTIMEQTLTNLNIPHELHVVPNVSHNFGQLYNQIGLWALQFHASCWQQ
jgi:enterochelin esterase-like enzyme